MKIRNVLTTLTMLFVTNVAYGNEKFVEIGIGHAQKHGGQNNTVPFNADIEDINSNSWRFTSNSNPRCLESSNSGYKPTDWNCKRGDIWLQDEAQYQGKTIKFTFDFTVEKYPSWPSPYFIIVLQDLLNKNAIQGGVRGFGHPMSTIKLKNYNGGLYLAHFDNSWQWTSSFDHTQQHEHIQDWNRGCWGQAPAPSAPSQHQENTCNGAFRIDKNVTYKVEFIIGPFNASLIVNGNVVSDVNYKTEQDGFLSHVKWGMYWSPDYNPTQLDSLRTIYRIENVKRFLRLN